MATKNDPPSKSTATKAVPARVAKPLEQKAQASTEATRRLPEHVTTGVSGFRVTNDDDRTLIVREVAATKTFAGTLHEYDVAPGETVFIEKRDDVLLDYDHA